MIYWIEHVPNGWVRGIAIVTVGAIAYFADYMAPPIESWTWAYGKCSDGQGIDPTYYE